jgi:gamma-glutamylputrescine oxidase
MPVSTQMISTAPLGEQLANSLIPSDMCVEDVRYILDYFRLSADKRMIFGGGTVYGGTDPADVVAKLRPNLEKVFPQLKGVKIDYAWSGNFALSFTRVPQMGRIGPSTYFAHGCSGHGVTGSHLFGRTLAEAIDGDASRFDIFEKLPWYPFPGGRLLRAQYSTIGSWWYSLRDAVGW